jgi:hypothetical protein
MRTEWGTSATGAIKDYNGRLDDFAEEARLEKIGRLRQSLAENTYHVSATDSARKIIEHMMQV